MRSLQKKILPLAFLLFLVGNHLPANAQVTSGTADKIIAVIGKNRIILLSQLEQEAAQASSTYGVLDDSMKCHLLSQLMMRKVLAEQAERDSLLVSDAELEGMLENRIRYFISRFGTKEEMERQIGKTTYQLKEENREIFRENSMADKMQQKLLANVKITPAEVSEFFNQQNKDSLPYYPAAVEVGQIVINPTPSAEVDKLAKDNLENIRNQIVSGEQNFETMAGLYSMDPGSRDVGGRINGVTRNGDLVQEFITNAFRLQKPGDVSPVFKTQFGYHIMQLINRKGEEADVRHILIIPERTSADYKAAMLTLDSARAALISGKITFAEAVAKYSTDEGNKMTGGILTNRTTGASQLPIDELDPQMVLLLDSMQIGTYSQPQMFNGAGRQGNEKAARIVFLKSRSEPHRANLRDDYSEIQRVALEQKKAVKMEIWLKDHLSSYYIKVDKDYQDCEALRSWVKVASDHLKR